MTYARAGSLVLSIVLAGCTPSSERSSSPIVDVTSVPSSKAPPSDPSSAASAAEAPPPDAPSAVLPAEPPTFPVPPTPPGADREKVLFASSVCPAAYRSDKSVGCRAPPPFDRPGRQPDGQLPLHTGDPLEFCELQRIYRGSFSRPSAKQAVLSFDQCKDPDDATWDSGFPGNAVLVEEIGGRWRTVANALEVNTGSCEQSRRADGRDVLLCRSGYSAASLGTVTYFVLLDFARRPKPAGTIAWLFSDASMLVCPVLPPSGPAVPSGLVGLAVKKVALSDVNKDGTPDLVVDVERARAAPSSALDARVRALCQQNAKIEKALPAATKARLELVSDGQSFAPSPATRKLLDAWEAETPDLTQLKAATPPALTP